jgi:hypothetical protein
MPFRVGPSKQRHRWTEFLARPQWDPAAFDALARREPPGVALFELEVAINGLYLQAEKAARLHAVLGDGVATEAQAQTPLRARWLAAAAERRRASLSALQQREIDLGLLRWIRRGGCLACVVGAGVTMDAGGPSWPALVRRLLVQALEHGHEVREPQEQATGDPDRRVVRYVTVRVERFAETQARRAGEIVAAIDAGQADTEALMEGAELCARLRGQHLFADIGEVLYEGGRRPGAVHRAVAALAEPRHVPDRGGWFPGWAAIISYNFDDLQGEAIDALGLARAAYAMRGDKMAADPNEAALKAGPQSLHQRLWHLHGYTPRRPFLITNIPFVFSTRQYAQSYGPQRLGIVEHVFDQWLARPVFHAIYVGCSFSDEAMNGLLKNAAQTLPGRMHWALLKWPGEMPLAQAGAADAALHGAPYLAMGVRPLWFERFGQIAQLLGRLA